MTYKKKEKSQFSAFFKVFKEIIYEIMQQNPRKTTKFAAAKNVDACFEAEAEATNMNKTEEKNMKKICILLAALAMTVATGCAKSASNEKDAETKTAAQVETQTVADNPKSVVRTVDPSLGGVSAFEAIKKNYDGKVVFVDFWATWCGPCRAAMKQVDLIKPALMEKGAAFVYITGETSPLETWNDMIPAIDGDHYRLTKDQWSQLCRTLGIPGIPAYVLFNADGSEAFSNLHEGGYPGNEVVKSAIENALTK